jgi:DNA-binding NtrC family response regulator
MDVRVIAATRHRLIERVKAQAFLYLQVPPLRDRRSDILVLLRHFLQLLSEAHQRPIPQLDAETRTALVEYSWPGNVQELRAVAERLVLVSNVEHIGVDDLLQEITRPGRA